MERGDHGQMLIHPLQHGTCPHTHSRCSEATTCTPSSRMKPVPGLRGDGERARGYRRESSVDTNRQHGPHPFSLSDCCETPKLCRNNESLRRRLLTSKSATEGKCSDSRSPAYSSAAPHVLESPEVFLSGPLSYSTLKSDSVTLFCRKRRLLFSRVVTSTLEDSRKEAFFTPRSAGGRSSPALSEPDLDESIISGLLPQQNLELSHDQEADAFHTPVNLLAASLSESLSVLSTPSRTPVSKLNVSEDSGFGSLRLDGSDCGVNEGSFQEGATQTVRLSLGRDQRRARLERQRRLSTLREGSLSEDEVKGRCHKGRGFKLQNDVFAETPPFVGPQLDRSLTPALQVIQALSNSFSLSHDSEHPTPPCLPPSHDLKHAQSAHLPLWHLIGRKMGLGQMDVLTELNKRNLHQILSCILKLLSPRDVYMCEQVSDSWSGIVLQDRSASRRRRLYEKKLKLSLEGGGPCHVAGAETRLALTCRSALGSVQAQAKTPSAHTHTPVTSSALTHTPPSTKRLQFLQVAKTLFSDECLRPCPRCEHPARCHSVKAEGVCSWDDCQFHFCTSCLRAYHGSADCSRLPGNHTRTHSRRSRGGELLPGSAQSKRNVRRL